MDRTERQRKIVEIIKAVDITTQEELAARLNEQGFKVTQATVSRDIKELKLVKVNQNGHYKYALPMPGPEVGINRNMLSLYRELVQSVSVSLNLVVVRTKVGNANSVAAVLDSAAIPGVLGSIAGDDAILIVAESVEAAPVIARQLSTMF